MWNAYLMLTLSVFLFSGNFIMGKIATESMPPFTLAFFRSFLAFLFLAPFSWKEWYRHRNIWIKEWKPLTILSLTGIAIFLSLVYLAIQYTTTINASIVEATTPVFSVILGYLFLGERFNRLQISGGIISLAGVLWLITGGSLQVIFQFSFNIGDLLMLASVISWSVYSLYVKRHSWKIPVYGGLMTMLLISCLFLVPFVVLDFYQGAEIEWNMSLILSLLYLGIFPSILALILWNKGVEFIGPSRASIFLNLIPVFTTFSAIMFLDESIGWLQIFGGMIVLSGVYLTTREKQSSPQLKVVINDPPVQEKQAGSL